MSETTEIDDSPELVIIFIRKLLKNPVSFSLLLSLIPILYITIRIAIFAQGNLAVATLLQKNLSITSVFFPALMSLLPIFCYIFTIFIFDSKGKLYANEKLFKIPSWFIFFIYLLFIFVVPANTFAFIIVYIITSILLNTIFKIFLFVMVKKHPEANWKEINNNWKKYKKTKSNVYNWSKFVATNLIFIGLILNSLFYSPLLPIETATLKDHSNITGYFLEDEDLELYIPSNNALPQLIKKENILSRNFVVMKSSNFVIRAQSQNIFRFVFGFFDDQYNHWVL